MTTLQAIHKITCKLLGNEIQSVTITGERFSPVEAIMELTYYGNANDWLVILEPGTKVLIIE